MENAELGVLSDNPIETPKGRKSITGFSGLFYFPHSEPIAPNADRDQDRTERSEELVKTRMKKGGGNNDCSL
jgi:hypothetical protein